MGDAHFSYIPHEWSVHHKKAYILWQINQPTNQHKILHQTNQFTHHRLLRDDFKERFITRQKDELQTTSL